MNSVTVIETLIRDVLYALRVLRRTPAFTATAVATLALAIAANTAVFSIVDAVLLRPLPYPSPDRLGLVTRTLTRGAASQTDIAVDGRTWEAVRDHADGLDRAVYSDWASGVNLAAPSPGGGRAVLFVQQQRVGAGFFRVLGVNPLIGREFSLDEDRAGGPPAVMLAHRLWQSVFHGEPAIVGRSVTLRGQTHIVVGVMPPGFQSGVEADVWTPLRASTSGEGAGENYQVIVRLPPGTALAAARDRIAALGAALPGPETPTDRVAFSLTPLQDGLTEPLRQPLLMLWAAVGVVLVIASVNLAGLLLARASGRAREIATRMALGSGRAGVVRQLVVESLVLAAIGGTLGLALGAVALDVLQWLAADALDIWQSVALDGRAAAVAAALSIAASLFFGLAPALQASRLDINGALVASGTRGIAGGGRRWSRRTLVIAQVALGVVLLVAAGLLLRTFAHLRALDPGFDGRGVVTASVSLDDERYRTADRMVQMFDRTMARLLETPGVEAAGVSLGLPYQRLLNLGFRGVDGPSSTGGSMTSAAYVTPHYFTAMRIPLRDGRRLTDGDTVSAPAVVLVNESFARTYFDGEQAVGRSIRISGSVRQIVGVVGDVQLRPGWGDNGPLAAMPLVYMPAGQVSDGLLRLVHTWFSPTFAVRSSLPPNDAAAALRRALDEVDPLLPFATVRDMSQVQAAAIAPQRFLMALLAALAAASVLLAAVGLHGLIATSVTERTREIGIRLALGATAAQAMRTLAVPGVMLAAAGTAIGLAASLGMARLLRHFVWGVSTNDPLTFVAVACVLLVVATAASVAPALRILRLDPAVTLRHL